MMRLTARIAREQSIGVLFTEHDMDVVFGADRVVVLNRGAPEDGGRLTGTGSREPAGPRHLGKGEGLVYDVRHRDAQ